MQQVRAALRRLGPAVTFYLLSVGLVGFVLDGGVFSVLLNLYLVRLGFGPELIGVVNSAGMLALALASLPAGALGARVGSQRMLRDGMLLSLLGTVTLPLADALPAAAQLPWLLVCNVVLYIGLAAFYVNTAPYIMGAIDAGQRSGVISLQTALMTLAAFAGSLLGGLMPPAFAAWLGVDLRLAPAPYRYALIIGAAMLVPALLALRASARQRSSTPERAAAAGSADSAARAPLALLLMMAAVRMLQVAGVASVASYLNVYLDTALLLPTAQIGAIIAAGRLLAVPAALSTAPLTRRYGARDVAIWASVGSALAILPIIIIPTWWAAALSFVAVTGLSWIRYAGTLVYFLDLVPPTQRALVSGVMETSSGFCFTAVTFGGGYLIASLGFPALFAVGSAVTALSAALFWILFRTRAPLGGAAPQ
jgi:MFS family permease